MTERAGIAASPRVAPYAAAGAAVACFHIAYADPRLAFFALGLPVGLVLLARRATAREAAWLGAAAGLGVVVPHLFFFRAIFGPAAVLLWGVVAVWTVAFVVLARAAFSALGPRRGALLVPFLWTGLEFFRSELYYLRFSWVTPGLAFAHAAPGAEMLLAQGVFLVGFLLAAIAAVATALPVRRCAVVLGVAAAGLALVPHLPETPRSEPGTALRVAGVQLEGADESKLVGHLDRALARSPDADLLVLPEYTLEGAPRPDLLEWCRRRSRHLVVGGTAAAPGGGYYNTAYVVGPEGRVVFRQGKSVPIQFFRDGLPAESQEVWASPWGAVGICVCYDLSYTRVVDGLVRKGARAIVVPTMDAVHWGAAQHRLHARIAPARAAEYGVPIVRVCSSGISQLVEDSGRVVATAPFPGQGEIIAGTVHVRSPGTGRGTVPPDRLFARICVAVTAAWALVAVLRAARGLFASGGGATSRP